MYNGEMAHFEYIMVRYLVGRLGTHHRLEYSLLCCAQHFEIMKTYVYCHFYECWTPVGSVGKWVPIYNKKWLAGE
jgi:hypothetical protein